MILLILHYNKKVVSITADDITGWCIYRKGYAYSIAMPPPAGLSHFSTSWFADVQGPKFFCNHVSLSLFSFFYFFFQTRFLPSILSCYLISFFTVLSALHSFSSFTFIYVILNLVKHISVVSFLYSNVSFATTIASSNSAFSRYWRKKRI